MEGAVDVTCREKLSFHLYYNYIYILHPTSVLQKSFHDPTTPLNLLEAV
jgi:hypothetical protein